MPEDKSILVLHTKLWFEWRGMRWAGQVACLMELRNASQIFAETRQLDRPLEIWSVDRRIEGDFCRSRTWVCELEFVWVRVRVLVWYDGWARLTTRPRILVCVFYGALAYASFHDKFGPLTFLRGCVGQDVGGAFTFVEVIFTVQYFWLLVWLYLSYCSYFFCCVE